MAVGEVLRRLVSRLGCAAVKTRLPDLLLPYGQVGVGIRCGLEAAVHLVRSCLDAEGNKEDWCCLKVDMENAFNSCDRNAFLRRTHQVLPELFAWVQWSYHSAGELRFGHHRVTSCSGVQQGDPLGSLLFSLCLLELLDAIGDRLPENCRPFLSLWYLDDGTLIGPRPVIRQFLDCLLSLGPNFGLRLNMAKCEIYWPSGEQVFTEFPPAIVRIGQHCDGLELLGSPVVGSPEFFAEAVINTNTAHRSDFICMRK